METDMSKQMSTTNSLNVDVQVLPMPGPGSRGFLMAQLTLRICVFGLTLAAALILAASRQTVTIFGIVMHASYTYSSACKFKLVADAFVCASSFLSVLFVYAFTRPKSNPKNYFYLLLIDLVMVVMVISGCAAGTAIGYVARYGQSQTGWMAICDRVGKFCDKVLLSITLSYLAFICVFFLTVMAAYRLKSLPLE